MTLEDLGWTLDTKQSMNQYLVYKREEEYLYIDLDKKKVEFATDNVISFATLEAIRKIIFDNAIY